LNKTKTNRNNGYLCRDLGDDQMDWEIAELYKAVGMQEGSYSWPYRYLGSPAGEVQETR